MASVFEAEKTHSSNMHNILLALKALQEQNTAKEASLDSLLLKADQQDSELLEEESQHLQSALQASLSQQQTPLEECAILARGEAHQH
jgi:hypothetical protein